MTAPAWVCFHCGEAFEASVDGRAAAREHFGPTPDFNPACIDQRTVAHEDAIARMRRAEQQAQQSLANAVAIEEQYEMRAAEIRDAVRRLGAPTLDAAVDEMQTLRLRLKDAETFSRAVYRMRPQCWQVAMIDAAGPGIYYPPAEPTRPTTPAT